MCLNISRQDLFRESSTINPWEHLSVAFKLLAKHSKGSLWNGGVAVVT